MTPPQQPITEPVKITNPFNSGIRYNLKRISESTPRNFGDVLQSVIMIAVYLLVLMILLILWVYGWVYVFEQIFRNLMSDSRSNMAGKHDVFEQTPDAVALGFYALPWSVLQLGSVPFHLFTGYIGWLTRRLEEIKRRRRTPVLRIIDLFVWHVIGIALIGLLAVIGYILIHLVL